MATDTGNRRYSKKESLDRIRRILLGIAVASDEPDKTLQGQLLSEDESLSEIAEIMADSLPGYSFTLPEAIQNDYGEIYTWTGTSSIDGLSIDVYTKITGSFQNTAHYSNVTCTPLSSNMTLSKTGYYFVSWSCSFQGSPDVIYWLEPYQDGVGIPQAVAKVKPSASGSSVNLAGSGIFDVTDTDEVIDLRVRPDTASAWFVPNSITLSVYRIGEYNA